MKVEQVLGRIVSRQQLLDWVKILPEESKGIIIVDSNPSASEEDMIIKFRHIGEATTIAESAYLAQTYIHYIFGSR